MFNRRNEMDKDVCRHKFASIYSNSTTERVSRRYICEIGTYTFTGESFMFLRADFTQSHTSALMSVSRDREDNSLIVSRQDGTMQAK